MDTFERDRNANLAAPRELDQVADPTIDPGLLDALPMATIAWTEVPGEVQPDLFDALQLQIRYDRVTSTARGQITLVGDTGDRIPSATIAERETRLR
jgi:hypothetical protein